MGDKVPSKDASPASSPKAAGNPALRMMGRSIVGEPSKAMRANRQVMQDYHISNSSYPRAIGLSSGL